MMHANPMLVALWLVLSGDVADSAAKCPLGKCSEQHAEPEACMTSRLLTLQSEQGHILLQSRHSSYSSQGAGLLASLQQPEWEVDQKEREVGHGTKASPVSKDAEPEKSNEVSEFLNGQPKISGVQDARREFGYIQSPPPNEPASNMSQNISFWNISIIPDEQPFVIDSNMEVVHETVAFMLVLFVAFVMSLTYLVNYPDLDIRQAAWQLLSRTVSIFIAVLISKSTKEVLCELIDMSCDNEVTETLSAVYEQHHEATIKAISISFCRWLMLWLAFQLFMLQYRGSQIVAISRLGGHVVAFAGMDAFTDLQSGEAPFDALRRTAVNSFGCALLVGVLMWLGAELAEAARKNISMKSSDPESLKEWLRECREAEDEAASLIIGLLLSQTIRHAISGEHPPLHGGKPKSKSNNQVFILLVIAIGLAALAARLETLLKNVLGDVASPVVQRHKKGIARSIRVAVVTMSMTMAWCILYWGEWFIYNWTEDKGVAHGDRMSALLVVAAVLSALCFAGIFIMVFAGRSSTFAAHNTGFHALSVGLGLVVGCAWEDVFIEAVGGVQLNFFKLKASYSTLLVIFILCLVTVPAWMLYILPQAENAIAAHSDQPHPANGSSSEQPNDANCQADSNEESS